VQANTSSGITTAKTINIIIINSSSNENYIAACIAAPENLQQINESMVLFNASTTRAINYTTSSGIKNISLDMLKFNWTFSDGINCLFLGNSYDCELSDKRKADTDSSSVSGYLFKKRFLNSGRNWAKLVISF
jgi:hypothetical protein